MWKAKVVYDKEWQEWQVQVWKDGKRHERADYHTDNREDAEGTLRLMQERWTKCDLIA